MDVGEWPEVLKQAVADVDSPMPKPKENYALSLSSLGAIIW